MSYIVFGNDNRMNEVRKLLSVENYDGICCVFAPNVRLALEDIKKVPWGAKVYCGGVDSSALAVICAKAIDTVIYNECMEFVERNAELTAEATLAVLLQKINSQLRENKILLIGFGKCGKAISKYLFSLAADFTIMTGKPKSAEIYTVTVDYEADISKFDVIINTAPVQVIDNKKLKTIKKEAIIIDIASKPYGLNHEFANELGIDSDVYPALPAKYRKVSAADAIVKLIKGEFYE